MLTEKQTKILQYLSDFIKSKGYSPDYKTASKDLKIQVQNWYRYLKVFKEKGLIEHVKGNKSFIRISQGVKFRKKLTNEVQSVRSRDKRGKPHKDDIM